MPPARFALRKNEDAFLFISHNDGLLCEALLLAGIQLLALLCILRSLHGTLCSVREDILHFREFLEELFNARDFTRWKKELFAECAF